VSVGNCGKPLSRARRHDETVDDALFAGFVEIDGELVTFELRTRP
jgi:hypothetical protein